MIAKNRYTVLVGKKIKELRLNAGYTTSKFARLINCKSEQQLYRYERGVNKIDLDTLVLALKVLNVDVGLFFEQIDESVTQESTDCYIDI
ncbi:helix-turn-helix domain-containing protein [Providencia rettgeri]|uniref:helix-turn-helix domain-containing protein n=1 Tax=Providencia rettgeri TaxID=587 RepID=UPI00235F7240|nr:helix-turn-helix transcriptional regulator [Providencia rettgeri]